MPALLLAAAALSLLALASDIREARAAMPVAAAESEVTLAESGAPAPMALGTAPVSVTLAPPASAKAELKARLRALAANDQVYLVLQGLRAAAPVEASYEVYLDLPRGSAPARSSPAYVGNFDFFDAQAKRRSAVFNITERLRSLPAGTLGERPTVTIVQSGSPDAAAKPSIERIALIVTAR